VTNVYLSFSSIKIHNTEANDNSSGWFAIGGAGTIDLTKVINLSKVVAVSKVPEGEYNLIRFNITSVVVTYNGKNYTASTSSSSLTVVIHPKLEVERDTLSAAFWTYHQLLSTQVHLQIHPSFSFQQLMHPLYRNLMCQKKWNTKAKM